MGKISEYDKVTTVTNTDTFLLESADGTKGITGENLAKAMNEMAGNPEATMPDFYAMIDELNKPELHRNVFRGKNLGSTFTDAQKSEIRNGTFKDLFIGDYWEIGGHVWRIVDINYWLNTGNIACTTHHLVIMPDLQLYRSQMNDIDTTTGGYVGSKMYTENLENAKAMVNESFGAVNILNHKELLTKEVTNGHASSVAWYDSVLELPNSIMMYGNHSLDDPRTIDNVQFALMRNYPRFINPERENQWLRDVASDTAYVYIVGAGSYRAFARAGASASVRPVFGIIG